MIKNFKGKRTLKKNLNEIKPKDYDLNPNILEFYNNDYINKPLYFTKPFFDENKNLENTTDNKNNVVKNDNPMLAPSLLIDSKNFLVIYDINDINDLILYIDKNIDSKPYDSINRILNFWIRDSFDYLKKNNKILCNIYYKIFKKYFNYEEIDEKEFTRLTVNFINKWFKINNFDDFKLNLGNDLQKFLSKKYEQ